MPYGCLTSTLMIPPVTWLEKRHGRAFMTQLTNGFTKRRCNTLPWGEGVCTDTAGPL